MSGDWQPGDPVYELQPEWLMCSCGTQALWGPDMPTWSITCPECGGEMTIAPEDAPWPTLDERPGLEVSDDAPSAPLL